MRVAGIFNMPNSTSISLKQFQKIGRVQPALDYFDGVLITP
jgi:hypothetical protein